VLPIRSRIDSLGIMLVFRGQGGLNPT